MMNLPDSTVIAEDLPKSPPGRIITFYSYKGGTGRSMVLANVAWILAMLGRRVLVIDWDLEAPGIHRYYRPFLPDPEMTETSGLIDFFVHFVEAARLKAIRTEETPREAPWFFDCIDLMRYSTALDYEFSENGVLDFIGAGQQGPTYGPRVNTFQWGEFYEKLGGGVFLEAVKLRLREDYNFVLIDSRTGMSDTSGICTVQMPDDLVVCFTLNRQSIFGAAATARSADLQRRRADGTQGLRIWPVPMRIELAEKERLEAARLIARKEFASFLWHISAKRRPEYGGSTEVPYLPYYAYDEVLATIADTPRSTASLLSSIERLTGHLTGTEGIGMPDVAPELRASLLARYQPTTSAISTASPTASPRFYLSYATGDATRRDVRELVEAIALRFGRESVFWDEKVPLGAKWQETLDKELENSDALIVGVGPEWHKSSGSRREMQMAINLGKPIVPLLVKGTSWDDVPLEIRDRRGFTIGDETRFEDLRAFVEHLARSFDINRPPASNVDDPQKGKWGGRSENDGRRLTADVYDRGDGWFLIGLALERFEGLPLEGDVEFHLHPSFHPSIIRVRVHDDHAVLKFPAWGAFTIGASADGGRTRLELDLANLPDAPKLFRSR